MNIKKRKKIFALSACLMAAFMNSMSIVNASPLGANFSDDDLEHAPISILRNPSITDPYRRSSSFMVPMQLTQKTISDETENFIPDELKEPLILNENLSGTVSSPIPGTGVDIQQPANFNNLQNYIISDNGTVEYNKPIFLRDPIIISGPNNDPENRPKVYFECLTTSQAAPVVFKNLDISGKIQAMVQSNVIFENCNIHHIIPEKSDYAVEVSTGSKVKFENCVFDSDPSARFCVVIRDGNIRRGIVSQTCFSNCKFNDFKVGVFAMNSANVELFDCEFSKCSDTSVFLTRDAYAYLKNCKFKDMNGKAIFLMDISNVKIEGCQFLKCKKEAITGRGHGNTELIGCSFSELENTAIRFIKGCKFDISKCRTNKVAGNCLNIESSNGNVECCTFSSNSSRPIIEVNKPNCFPIIENCYVEQLATKSNTCVIAVRNGACPIFKGVSVRYADSTIPCMICEKFSRPTIIDTDFKIIDSDKVPEIRVFDASKLKFFVAGNEIDSIEENVTDLSTLDLSKNYLNIIEKTHGGVAFLSSDKEIDCNEILPRDFELDDDSYNESVDKLDKLLGDKFDEKFYNDIDNMCYQTSEIDDNHIVPFLPCSHILRSCPKCNSKNIMFDPNTNKLTCENCKSAIDFSEMDFRCPTCRYRVNNNDQLYRVWEVDAMCLICLENPATNFFMNCGHKCVCSDCKQKLIKKGFVENCPYCNELSKSSGIDFLYDDDE